MNKDSIQYDILKEVFNISVGKAADMLSEMVNRKILLSVPNIEIMDEGTDVAINSYLPEKIAGTLMVSSISFEKQFLGRANLIFPADKMKKVISLCMHDDTITCEDLNFSDIDFDIIKEVGNIILNCIMGETANCLDASFEYSLPDVKVYSQTDFDKDIKESGFSHVLVLYISFTIDATMIEGAIVVDLTMNSLRELLKKLDEIEANLYE